MNEANLEAMIILISDVRCLPLSIRQREITASPTSARMAPVVRISGTAISVFAPTGGPDTGVKFRVSLNHIICLTINFYTIRFSYQSGVYPVFQAFSDASCHAFHCLLFQSLTIYLPAASLLSHNTPFMSPPAAYVGR